LGELESEGLLDSAEILTAAVQLVVPPQDMLDSAALGTEHVLETSVTQDPQTTGLHDQVSN